MKSCSKCSRENPDDVAFCVFCGSKFSILCPNCGRENPVDVAFCGYCGTPRTNLLANPAHDQSVTCPNCGHRQLVGLASCTNCLSPLVVNDKPGQSLPVQPEVASKPVAPVSPGTLVPETKKHVRSVWLIGAIWAVLITFIVTLSKVLYITDPAYLNTQLIVGTPAAFILWWLVFTLVTFIWRKSKTNQFVRVIIVLLVIAIFYFIIFVGGIPLRGIAFFAPAATPTKTPRPTPTMKIMPICAYGSTYRRTVGNPFKCISSVELTLDSCLIDEGNVIMKISVENSGTTTIKNILIIGLLCDNKKGCEPISYPPGFTPTAISNPSTAFAQSDWYSIYDLRPRKIEAFTLEVVLPPNTSNSYCKVDYYIP